MAGRLADGLVVAAEPARCHAMFDQVRTAAGQTGTADPRLLDLIRNLDEDEDRSDLTLAQG